MSVFIDEVLNNCSGFNLFENADSIFLISTPLVSIKKESDSPKVENIPADEYVQQMLVGLLLSDGTLVKKYVGGGTYFQMAQSIIHLPYIVHVHALFFAGG